MNRIERDRIAACKWAYDLLLAPGTWALADTETTGINGVIVEIAIIDSTDKVLFNSLIHNDGERIEEGARRVHGITDTELATAPRLHEVWPQIVEALTGRTTLIAYNSPFDQARIEQSAARYGLPMLPQKWQCAMRQYARYVGDWQAWSGSYRWQRLPGTGHRALGDAQAALKCIETMAAEYKSEQESISAERENTMRRLGRKQ